MPVPSLGEQEHIVLQAVVRLGRATVRQVFEAVGEPRGLAYTTIATVLDRLQTKGFVARTREGNAHVYTPTKQIPRAEKARARSLIARVLGPDPAPAMASLVDAVEAIDPALLDRLAEEVDARRRTRRGS